MHNLPAWFRRFGLVTAIGSLCLAMAGKVIASDIPGIRVSDKDPSRWQGDFDGDGVTESLLVVEVRSPFRPAATVTPLNFWNDDPLKAPQPLALRVTNSRSKQTFLIHSRAYFGSPIWQEKKLPIEIARRGSKPHQEWAKTVKSLRGDGIVLGTEAGIDTLLYWDGGTYRLYQPQESP